MDNQIVENIKFNQIISELKEDVERIITQYSTSSFKIGKTTDEERRKQEYDSNGYQYLFPIAYGKCNLICDAEKELIKLFKSNNLCENQQEGGGNSKADILYVAVKCKIKCIDELYDDVFYEPKLI